LGVDYVTVGLDGRFVRRGRRMGRERLVERVRTMPAHGLRDGRTASRALGYQQVLRYLAGECTEEQAKADTVQATRRFVRRQRSWFRRDPRIHWLDGADPDLARTASSVLAAQLPRRGGRPAGPPPFSSGTIG